MTALLVVLAVTGWMLAVALLIGRGIAEADLADDRGDLGYQTWITTETIRKSGRRR